MKMNSFVIPLMALWLPCACIAQEVIVKSSGSPAKRVSGLPEDDSVDLLIDRLRQHLVFVFDAAQYHSQPDSRSEWKRTQAELLKKIDSFQKGSYLEMTLTTPTPITIEKREFMVKKMWVSIREEDWATFDWMFRTPEGEIVALSGIEGYFNRQIGPIIRELLEPDSEPAAAGQPATRPLSK
mgnify:CR=1 FL=1